MKKAVIFFILLFIFTLSGCSENTEMNLSVFIDYYNFLSENKIDYTDFSFNTSETGDVEYFFTVKDNTNLILVKLIEEFGEIKECRVIMSKLNENAEIIEITEKHRNLFSSTAKKAGCSFARCSDDEIIHIITQITSEPDATEKTEKFKDYNLIYISNDICSEFIIKDKWFFEEETTEKPENINSFLNTAPVRTETVPHR